MNIIAAIVRAELCAATGIARRCVVEGRVMLLRQANNDWIPCTGCDEQVWPGDQIKVGNASKTVWAIP